MDLYTRTAMTSTRHGDLLREADNARLAANGETTSPFGAVRRPVARLRSRLAGLAFHGPKHVVAGPEHG
jgi:hypothetical protein